MTDLRDARLQRALQEAPDAGALPRQPVRDAIRAAAHDAVRPWWQRWLPSGRTARWAPAFATVLLAGLVIVLWQGQEVPDARPGADQAAPTAAPAPAKEAGPAPAKEAAPAPAQEAVIPGLTEPAPDLIRGDPSPPVTAPAPAAKPQPPKAQERQEPLQRAAPRPPAAAPPEPPPAPMAQVAPAAPAAAPAPPPAPAPQPPPATAAPAPAAAPDAALADLARRAAGESRTRSAASGLAAQRPPAPAGFDAWTQVRVEADGASVVVPRGQADTLPALLARMLRSETVAAPAAGAAQLRLELAQDGEPVGVLESIGGQWRWQPLRETAPARGLRPPPMLDAQLREEAERLLRK